MQRPCQFSKKGGFCKITERNKGDGLCLSRCPLPPPLAGNTVFFTDKTAFSRFFPQEKSSQLRLAASKTGNSIFQGKYHFFVACQTSLRQRPRSCRISCPDCLLFSFSCCNSVHIGLWFPPVFQHVSSQEQPYADHFLSYLNMPYRHPAQFGPGQTADGCPPLLIPFILLA